MLFEQAASNSRQGMASFFKWIQILVFKDLDIVSYNAGIWNKFFDGRRNLRNSLIITY
jgi:hypothetical protein